MLKNNVEVDVKVKCIEDRVTQAKLAEEVGTSAPYVSRLIRNNEKSLIRILVKICGIVGARWILPHSYRYKAKKRTEIRKKDRKRCGLFVTEEW